MSNRISGTIFGEDERNKIKENEYPSTPASFHVLIVGKSRVNTVVISKIVERSGLRYTITAPEMAWPAFTKTSPALIILDGGAMNADCADLLKPLAEVRRLKQIPSVILLATRNFQTIDEAHADVVDAIVSKPILPELLQPVVDRLIAARRV